MSNLNVSDWVTFLSSERDVAYNTVLNFGAILLAFVGMVCVARTVGFWQTIIDVIIALAFATYALYKVFKPFGRRGKVAGKILNKIMSGELESEKDIREKWLRENKR